MLEFQFIQKLLPEIGAFILERYGDRAALDVSTKKGVADLVTEADTQAQERIEAAIAAEFPGDLLVGEESGKDRPPADPDARCWVCDPVDGTHNFARGMVPGWGVSLAFVHRGEPLAGGVFMPGLHEMFLAQHGGGATRNGKKIHVSPFNDLAEARVEIDFSRPSDRQATLAISKQAVNRVGQVRCHGSAVVGLCTVACGSAEGFMHGGLQPWDYAAAMLIVREAGGKVTRFNGTDAKIFDQQPGLLASNTLLHEELLAGIQKSKNG